MFNELCQLFVLHTFEYSYCIMSAGNVPRMCYIRGEIELLYKGRSGIQPLSMFHVSFLIVTIACNFSFSPIASHVFCRNVPRIVSFAPHHVPFRSPITPLRSTLLIVPPRVFHFIVTRSRIQTSRKLASISYTHHHFILLFRVATQAPVGVY